MSGQVLQYLIDKMGSVAIDTNYMQNHNWGVLFDTVEGDDEAWIVGEAYACRFAGVEKLDYNFNAPFYNVEEGEWTRNTISAKVSKDSSAKVTITPSMLREKLEYVRPKTTEEIMEIANITGLEPSDINRGAIVKFRIPYGTFYNLVNFNESKLDRKRERLIIKPTPFPMRELRDNSIIMLAVSHPRYGVVLTLGPGKEVFPEVDPDKFWTAGATSLLQPKDLIPGRLYECVFPDNYELRTIDEMLLCNADVKVRRCLYKGLNIMRHYSKNGYLMAGETIEDVLNTNLYNEGYNMIRFPLDENINPEYYDVMPVMLDCNITASLLDLFTGFNFIDINVSPNPKDLVLIEGVRESDRFPIVQAVISPLLNSVGDIR